MELDRTYDKKEQKGNIPRIQDLAIGTVVDVVTGKRYEARSIIDYAAPQFADDDFPPGVTLRNHPDGTCRIIVFNPYNDGLRKKRATISELGKPEKMMFCQGSLALDLMPISTKLNTATIILEITYSTVSLDPKKIRSNPFLMDIDKLMVVARSNLPKLQEAFDLFYSTWGSHYIDSCSIGGAIILEITNKKKAFTNEDEEYLNTVGKHLEDMVIAQDPTNFTKEITSNITWSLKSYGGNDLRCSGEISDSFIKNIATWKESVKNNPICLPTSYCFRDFTLFFPTTRENMGEYSNNGLQREEKELGKIIKNNMTLRRAYKSAMQSKLEGSKMCNIL